jgi:hypothetical protein
MVQYKDKQSSIILFCQGGAGDVLAHTPMIRAFKRTYPEDKIIVLSTYSQLLEHNPHIDLLISLKEPKAFYEDHVLNQNVRFFKKHFVYNAIMDEPAQGCTCLPEFICKLYGAEYDGEKLDYYVTDYENRVVDTFVNQYAKMNLPLVLLHCTGAIPSDGNFNKTNSLKDLNIGVVSELVKRNSERALFIQIGLHGEPVVEGAIDALGMTMREAIALIGRANSFIFIESLFAHCSNALGVSGVVVFQNTSPKFFGYDNNTNIANSGGCKLWPCNRPVGALLDIMPGYRNPKTRQSLLWECPDQVCARASVKELEAALHESLGFTNVTKGNAALEKARNTLPPKVAAVRPSEPPSLGKVTQGDPGIPVEKDAQSGEGN